VFIALSTPTFAIPDMIHCRQFCVLSL